MALIIYSPWKYMPIWQCHYFHVCTESSRFPCEQTHSSMLAQFKNSGGWEKFHHCGYIFKKAVDQATVRHTWDVYPRIFSGDHWNCWKFLTNKRIKKSYDVEVHIVAMQRKVYSLFIILIMNAVAPIFLLNSDFKWQRRLTLKNTVWKICVLR